jgi:3-phosphoshikimate 1-carboxyvinyltransferase
MRLRRIRAATTPLDATLRAVPSKSVTHRALVAAALAAGESSVLGPLVADDTRATRDGLAALGIVVRESSDRWIVRGCGGDLPGGGAPALGESGTSLRFLLAVAALGRRPSRLDGAARLRQRPIQELVRALESLGAAVRPVGAGDGLPLEAGGRRPGGGRVRVAASRSSQFASALLLVGPCLEGGVEVVLEGRPVSQPYLRLTVDVLTAFGATVRPLRDTPGWRVEAGGLRATGYRVEGDHSSASYPLAAAAIVGGRVRVHGIDPDSAQSDARLTPFLETLGCAVRRGPDWIEVHGSRSIPAFDVDLSDAPDLAPTVAVIGLFADGASVLRGIAHLRIKESDRLELLARNLTALGRPARAVEDRLEIGSAGDPAGGAIQTGSDHRMAMAFAVAGLRIPGVTLDDADCVAKSNPGFWRQFASLEPREPSTSSG